MVAQKDKSKKLTDMQPLIDKNKEDIQSLLPVINSLMNFVANEKESSVRLVGLQYVISKNT
jgi:hypothetical protein